MGNLFKEKANKTSVGTTFTFGEIDGKRIEWTVIKEDDYKVLVISSDALFKGRFASYSHDSSWGKSELRKYLNGDFFTSAFTEAEQKKIVNTKLADSYGVKDDIFILSMDEMSKYLKDDKYEKTHYNSCSYCCWTRTETGKYIYAGYARGCWCKKCASDSYNVRPAMYIRKSYSNSK